MAALTTLADVKVWLGINGTADDVLLQRLIDAAGDFIEAWCNRSFAVGAHSDKRNGAGGVCLMLANRPVQSVQAVTVDGVAIPAAANGRGGYVYDDMAVQLTGGYRFAPGRLNVEVQYTAGYAVIPPDVAQACIEIVALKYKERDRIGVASKGLAGETSTFSLRDMPDAARALLTQYRNVVPT